VSLVSTFDFDTGVSGNIVHSISYTTNLGAANVIIAYVSATGYETRGFMHFDTSSIPSNATVSKVEWLCRLNTTQPATPPNQIGVYIGQWIGSSLSGSSDFAGGTFMIHDDDYSGFLDNTWYDLGLYNDPTGYVGKGAGATTDLAIRETQHPTGSSGRNFNGRANCQLRVTYTYPISITCVPLSVGTAFPASAIVKGQRTFNCQPLSVTSALPSSTIAKGPKSISVLPLSVGVVAPNGSIVKGERVFILTPLNVGVAADIISIQIGPHPLGKVPTWYTPHAGI
jgi:hypothetical protein